MEVRGFQVALKIKTGTNQLTGLWWAGGITPFDHIAHQLANSFVPAISQSSFQSNCDILLLVFMTILAQSFFTLVRCHLVAFTFLSVWHSRKILILNVISINEWSRNDH
jgi:hypothetical protein